MNPTTIVTSCGQRSAFRVQDHPGHGKPRVAECDECGKVAPVFRTGRERKSQNNGTKAEYLCEAHFAELSTDPDPFGVMEEA